MPITDNVRRAVLLWLAVLCTGCGQSHECVGSASGLAGCQSLGTLSDAEMAQFCRWETALAHPGLRPCEDGFSVTYRNTDQCMRHLQALASRDCARTVVEHERCTMAVVEDPCNAHEPVCTDIPACNPEPGADAGP